MVNILELERVIEDWCCTDGCTCVCDKALFPAPIKCDWVWLDFISERKCTLLAAVALALFMLAVEYELFLLFSTKELT